jgi:S-DNA-T family DNA segregation ATPase FtsK/SpoIIIE
MISKTGIKRLEEKIEELSEKMEIVLERQNQQYTDIMLFLKNGNDGNGAISIDNRSIEELYEEAKEEVIEAGKASTSYLQRILRIGYVKAALLMDMLESRGVVGPDNSGRPREVIINE